MNTQAHALLNYVILKDPTKKLSGLCIFIGAILPDFPMLIFYFVERIIRKMPEPVIWNELYYQPHWQNFIDIFNSIPIFLGLLLVSWFLKSSALKLVCLSSLIHVVCDFGVHREDAHRHFYPFSDYRFESSISYWDPNHGGLYFSVAEFLFFLTTSIFIGKSLNSRLAKGGLVLGNMLYIVTYGYFVFSF